MSKSLSNIVASGSTVFQNITLSSGTSSVTLTPPLTGTYILSLPTSVGINGQVLSTNGAGSTSWITVGGTGTVTSVGLTVPSFLNVTPSSITTIGTFAITATSTGTGNIVLSTSPTLVTPILGVASATSLTLSTPLATSSGGTGLATTGFANAVLTTNGTTSLWAPVGSLTGTVDNFMQLITSVPVTTGVSSKLQGCALINSGNAQFALLSGTAGNTVVVYNVSNPLGPIYMGSLALAGTYRITTGTWPYCYVPSSGSSTLYVVNLSNPNSPAIQTSVIVTPTVCSIYTAELQYPYLYCCTQSYGLYVVDVSQTPPVVVFKETLVNNTVAKCSSATISAAGNLFTNDYLNYTANGPVIKTWNISTPSTPSLLATTTFPAYATNQPEKIVARGTNIFMTTASATVGYILIFDISTPTAPTIISSIQYNGAFQLGTSLSFSNNYMYVPASAATVNRTSPTTVPSAFDLYDISTIASPVKIASMTDGILGDVFFGGALNQGFIYTADYGVAPGSTGAFQIYSCAQENSYIAKTITGSLSMNATSKRIGTTTLVGGTVTVANTTVDVNSQVYLTVKTVGGTQGLLSYTISSGVSFTITSTSSTDTSVVSYFIIEQV